MHKAVRADPVSYKTVVGPDDPPTAYHVWEDMAWCDDCGSLMEGARGRPLLLDACTHCQSTNLLRPPAYSPMQLQAWCVRRCAQIHLRMFSPQRLCIVTSPVNRQWDHPETQVLLSPAARLELERKEREKRDAEERRREGVKGRHVIEQIIDMEALKKAKPTEDLSDEDIIEEAFEKEAWRKRKGEKKLIKMDIAIQQARKMLGEGPNRDKRFTVVVPGKLLPAQAEKGDNHA